MKALRIILWTLVGLILLIVGSLCAITWYFTPDRLSEFLSHELSENLNAEVKVENARFTFWSSFPRFMLETDSVIVVSHSLDSLPKAQLDALPGNPRVLATASAMKGGINVLQLLRGRYVMHDLDLTGLHLNFVAVNDSVNNYDILPRHGKEMEKLPFFTTNILTLNRPRGIDIYFADSDTHSHVDLDSVVMRRLKEDTDYDLSLRGRITARTSDLTIFNNFPFYLHGDINLGFKPFKLKFENFAIDLESVKSKLDMTVDLQGDMKISSMNYTVSMINLMKLLEAFPWLPLGNLSHVDTDFSIELTAHLDRPYTFSSGELPWVTVTAEVPGGNIDYQASDGRIIPVGYSSIAAGLHFDGSQPKESTLFLHPVTLTSDESALTLSAQADNLLGAPSVTLSFSGQSDLNFVADRFPELKNWDVEGDLVFSGNAFGHLEALSAEALRKGLQEISFAAEVDLDNLHFNIDDYDFKSATMHLSAGSEGYSPDPDNMLNVPIKVSALGTDARLGTPSGDITYITDRIEASTTVSGINTPEGVSLLPVDFSAKNFKLAFGKREDYYVTLHDASAAFGQLKAHRYLPGAPVAPAMHYLNVKAKTGELHTAFSKMVNPLTDIDVFYSPDSVNIRNLGIRCLSTYARLKGTAVNLSEFTHSKMRSPLRVDMDIDCDTIDINQIAHTYYRGSKKAEPKPAVASAQDTIPIIIPRNIDATVNLHADESIYTNLHLFDLGGRIRVERGKASVENFIVKADFGHATLGVSYDTSDIENMRIGASVSLLDIDVVKFFSRFHTLLLMMPQMSNLKGMVSLTLEGGLTLFPDMYINMPSLHAVIGLKGWDLTVHQNHFIHRLARKLLIRGDHDLHIRNMDVTAQVRDNLLELYPFDFQVGDYLLRAEGTNNFNGNLYYHIDVKKSPVPFPFGVNVEGLFHDPKIRFGRARYNRKRGEEVTLENEVSTRMNLVKEVKYYAKEFVRKAAESKED